MKRAYSIYLTFLLPFIMILAAIFSSCQHDSVNKNELRKINFEGEVLPIFKNNCTAAGCHGSSGNGESEMVLDNYDGIMQGITKGNPSGSRIYSAITSTWSGIMPPNKALSPTQILTIKLWIEQGAENSKIDSTNNNDTTKLVDQSYPVCFSRDIIPIITSNCTNCHNSMNSYPAIRSLVSAKHPENSELYIAITSTDDDRMPKSPNAPLSQANIDSIYNWIKNGAINDSCPSICDTTHFAFKKNVWPIINTNCKSCHSGSSANKGIRLEDYSTISFEAKSGGLINAINGYGVKRMPPTGSLTPCNIKVIENWVNNKYPDN